MDRANFFSTEILNYSFLGNSVTEYFFALAAFLILSAVFKLFHDVILKKLGELSLKTKTDLDETFVEIINGIRPPFYFFLAVYSAFWFIEVEENFWDILTAILVIWVVYQVVIASGFLVDYAVRKYTRREKYKNSKSAIELLGKITKGVLWIVAILFILSNLGVNITSLMAGLGIGGIAVALALQSVLNDLFSSFAIHFDKPFVPGDFIIVGDDMGVVEHIGIKTTRLRALQGEEIVISNQELTAARIHNFKKMQERRVTFSFGVTYETSNQSLKKIPAIVGEIIKSVELARFDRAHFKSFSDSSLGFEIVYYTQTPDFNKYMDVHQEIHFRIKESLEKEGISMAYPTQTLYIKSESK